MTEGTIKTSKYEIIAIFREELRKRTEIEIFFNNTSIITQLTRVDFGNDSNLLIVFYVQIMPDDFVMQLHR
ncbi:hypothetical protein RAG69_25045, partial [Klebsiella pneumoniae]